MHRLPDTLHGIHVRWRIRLTKGSLPAVIVGARLLLLWCLLNSDASLIAITLAVSICIVGEAAVLPLAIAVHKIAADADRLVTTIALIAPSSCLTSLTATSAVSTARATAASTHGRC